MAGATSLTETLCKLSSKIISLRDRGKICHLAGYPSSLLDLVGFLNPCVRSGIQTWSSATFLHSLALLTKCFEQLPPPTSGFCVARGQAPDFAARSRRRFIRGNASTLRSLALLRHQIGLKHQSRAPGRLHCMCIASFVNVYFAEKMLDFYHRVQSHLLHLQRRGLVWDSLDVSVRPPFNMSQAPTLIHCCA